MIVPLLSGSGMRVKILEGLALGRIVITTSLGLEGINAKHKEEVLIADTKEEFMDCIQFCYDHTDELQRISKQAQRFVKQQYDNQDNASHIKELYKDLLLKYKGKRVEFI
jgi:glycosyltransferase involved in cell wall biosynthesis